MFLIESNMTVQFYNFLALLCVFAAVITAQTSTGETAQPKLSWKNFKTAHKLKCKPGEYAVCKPCPRDQMTKKESVVGQCVDCTLYGKGTPKEGSSRCRGKCVPGKKYVDSSSTCEPCEAGTYMDIRGLNDTCKSCGPNMTSEAGARKCECMAGFQQVNGRCEACPEGRFKPEKGNSSCSKCPTNTTTLMDGAKNNKTECVLSCLPGQQYNQTTQVCDPCKPGFSKELGGRRTKCEPCPINTVAPKNGSRRCNVKCGKGYGLTADGCKNCTWNTYKSSPGNDACTPCPSGTNTWSKGAKSIHECISPARECVATAIEQIRKFYEEMEHITLGEDADIIAAVLATCNTPTAETFKKFSSSFMTCPELIQVQLPEVDIHGRKYTDADQKNVIKIIQEYLNYNSNGDYCEYLECTRVNGKEVQDCINAMTDKETGHLHDFCSVSGRVGASCVMLNFQSCPALQYSKVAEKIKVTDVSKLVRAKDVQSFCTGEEGEDSGIWNGGETGGGSCEDHLKQILSELHMSATSDICSESYRLRQALSCFEEHAIEDKFNNLYRSQINNLIPSAAVVGLPEMTLRELIMYLDTSCVNNADCGAALEPLLYNLDASRICDQYPSLRSALSCFVDNGQEHMFTEEHRANIEPFIMSIPPVGHTAGMSLNEMISILDTTCSSTGSCGDQLMPILTTLDMSNMCSQYPSLRSALSCFVDNGQEHMFTEVHRANIEPLIMSISPVVHTAGMSLNEMISILDTSCSSTGGCASLLDPQLLDLSMSNLCSRSDPLLQALHCYQNENEMEFMQLYYDRIFNMIDGAAAQYFPGVNSMTLHEIIYFLGMYCPSQGTGGEQKVTGEEQSPCALGMEDALSYPHGVTNFCDGAIYLVNALRCFVEHGSEEEFLMNDYSSRMFAIMPFNFADPMSLTGIIADIENHCPGMSDGGDGGETGGIGSECVEFEPILTEVTAADVCFRYGEVKSALSCFYDNNLGEHFMALYSGTLNAVLGFDVTNMKLEDIMNFLAQICTMPTK